MDKETLRMQMLAGVITEGEYKAIINKEIEEEEKASLNESMIGGIVGIGAINQIPSTPKTDYEMAFEHFLGQKYSINEEITVQDLNQYKSAMFDQLKFERDERPQELVDDGEFDTLEDAQSILAGKTDNDLRKIVDITCNDPEFLKAVNGEIQDGSDIESAIDLMNWEWVSNPVDESSLNY
jgi:hypothetical protein